uniref:FAD dependent oxidoreductase domain-containing protein n=1 Tax=viral metagenome TaxID=1070528 RepID=A0A6C0H6U9_9ZZZZ
MTKSKRVAVIGGGISGCLSAIQMSKLPNVQVDLYERKNTLLQGSPYCHLHAGGFLYPDISVQDCMELLNNSLEFAEYFGDFLDRRPLIVAYNVNSQYNPQTLVFRARMMQMVYCCWVSEHGNKYPLGHTDQYIAIFTRQDVEHFQQHNRLPETTDKAKRFHQPYVEAALSQLCDFDSIKYPFVSVNEPGIRQSELEQYLINTICGNVDIQVYTKTLVSEQNVKPVENGWNIVDLNSQTDVYYEYLVDACGGLRSKYFQVETPELLELKSSWVVYNNSHGLKNPYFPEIAIIGSRGTKDGLIQITPIGRGTFQVHYMNTNSTIFHENKEYIDTVIENDDVSYSDVIPRMQVAIHRITELMPVFSNSAPLECLWGLQRTVGTDVSKRTSQIIFRPNRADIQLTKASSIVTLVKLLTNKITESE